jgi:hypothetical protein
MNTLYETDFAEWAFRNAELLRTGRVSEADLENIAEEIESLGISQRSELKSRITQALEHLLKLRLAPEDLKTRNAAGWRGSVERQRGAIRRLVEDSPSLKRHLTQETLERCYSAAARVFAAGFGIQPPERCPSTVQDVLGE